MDEKYELWENLFREFGKNIQSLFPCCVPGKMQVVWVTFEGFINKERIVSKNYQKNVRKNERMQ